MRHQKLNASLSESLQATAHRLQQISLEATPTERDQLMFLCGQAASGRQPLPPSRRPMIRFATSAAALLLAFASGGFAMRLAGRGTPPTLAVTSSPLVDESPSQLPAPHGPMTPQDNAKHGAADPAAEPNGAGLAHLEPEHLEAIRSGTSLYAAMDPQRVALLPSPFAVASVPRQPVPLRAGMVAEWFDQM